MSNYNDLLKKFLQQKNAIISKGGIVNVANVNPSPNELLAGINSIVVNRPQVTASNGYAIIVAERPNKTIKLYNSSGSLLSTKTTNSSTGGYVTFTVSSIGEYIAKVYDADGTEIWTNSININEPGVFNIKSGLALNEYTWDEISIAGLNGYAKYMFRLWDFKKLSSFMGSTSDTYTKAYIIGFEHDNKVSGGKAGITFMIERTSSSYKHWSTSQTNDNGISWVGSLIRANCLKNGEIQYVFDKTVSETTEGTYYIFDNTTNQFVAQTLPENFVATQKYYNKVTISADGAFIAGLPQEIINYIVQVKKKTWGGYGGSVLNSTNANADDTIIETEDWMFIPSDGEVFGNTNRYSKYSKFTEEGETYEAFKEYNENRFWCSTSRWLRSPSLSGSSIFCCWFSNGYVTNTSASNAYYCPLCFCIG